MAKQRQLKEEDKESAKQNQLNIIAQKIRKDSACGYGPSWQLHTELFEEDKEIDDADREHIAECIEDGYIEGELVSGEESVRGYWKLVLWEK